MNQTNGRITIDLHELRQIFSKEKRLDNEDFVCVLKSVTEKNNWCMKSICREKDKNPKKSLWRIISEPNKIK